MERCRGRNGRPGEGRDIRQKGLLLRAESVRRLAGRLPLPGQLRRLLAAESSLWAVLLLVVPILAVGLTLILEPVDPDYWWHLAAGNWILAHHRVPFTDPFSWTHGGQPWIAHEWLAEVILALANRVAGYAGALLLTGAIAVAGYWLLLQGGRRYGLSRRCLALLMIVWGGIPLWALAVRPQVWGWAMLCLLLSELAAYQSGHRRRLWALPLLFIVWININLTALIGIGCLGVFTLDMLVRSLYRGPRSLTRRGKGKIASTSGDGFPGPGSSPTTRESDRAVDRHLVEVSVVCLAALLVNPHGAELVRFAVTYADPNALRYQFIGEWQRPSISDLTLLPFWLSAPMLLAALWTMVRRRALWPPLLVLLFFAESLKAQRYTPLYGLMLIPFAGWVAWARRGSLTGYLAPIVPFQGGGPPTRRSLFPPTRLSALVSLAAAVILAMATLTGSSEFRRIPSPHGYPAAAATVLRGLYPPARLFNTYTWGGYLIYRLYPANRVYVDGREEMYGDPFLRRFLELAAGDPSWRRTFDQEGINAVLAEREAGIVAAVQADPAWHVAYADQSSILLVRSP